MLLDVRVTLLGGVGAVTGRGEPADVGPPKCQALLAALALSPGAAVPVRRLVELVWGEERPRTAERTLQSYVVRLRQALGPSAIATVNAAYRLDLAPEAIDVVRFSRHADAGDLDAALAEWSGVPLAGLDVPGLAPAVDGLVERWLAVVEAELTRRVETDPEAAVGRLTELTTTHPFREGLWALLMTALYRSGRQTDALAAYQKARGVLVEHLGVEPGPRLRELEAQVLGHDERLAPAPRPTPASPALASPTAGTGRPGNLPPRLGRLIGREKDLATVRAALAAAPVVTLVGPGGIGKTRLAVAAASREDDADGAWLVDLVEIGSDADVPRAVAVALGVKESAGRALTASVVASLRARRVLLVLDNCEHVVDGAAALAQTIADGCPGTRVLATSREPLGLRDGHERVVPVGPLVPDGPAVELFTERATALSPAFDPAAAHQEVVQICRRLEGVPLAVELAAARTTTLTPADLLARLDDQLRLLVGGGRSGAPRHRAMRATIRWSHDLLDPAERRLLRRLAVFVGAFDVAAAETVTAWAAAAEEGADAEARGRAGGDATIEADTVATGVDELLGRLVARSMVIAEPGPSGRRLRLLAPIRQFAAEQLAASGEADLMAEHHAAWCVQRLGAIHRLLTGQGEVAGVARLDELWPNLRAAFGWAHARGDRRLAHALVRPIVTEIPRRSRGELGDWVERLLAMIPPEDTDPEDTDVVAFGLTWAGQRYKLAQDPAAFERLAARHGTRDDAAARHARASVHQDYPALEEATPPLIAGLRRRGDHDLAEHFEIDVAAALIFAGRFDDGDPIVAALVDRYRAGGPPTLLNVSLILLGYSAMLRGRRDRAEELFGEAVGVEVPARTHSPNRCVEAGAYFRRGEAGRAFAVLRGYVDELLDSGNMQAVCVTAVEFVNMMVQVDRLPEAARILRHLDHTAPYWATLVAAARQIIDAAARAVPQPAAPPEPSLDDHQALAYMRRVLTELMPEALAAQR
ncbi:winged helix-turn-helix domain-containing protein [Frankia sp. CN7]|nr:winged helix-turn-helix domain-containing protein [Frankia nepalensis]MBL7511090.1 winged helix-turn-helix domain-containing protein [Frankia nepalensis]